MIQVSVIIPIHNSEKYLVECISSVLSQSFHQIEVLCIDGGSRDHSLEIIKNFQKQDQRIHLICDPNTSYGHKLNIGIDKAKGKYIAIAESDDRMESNMIEILYQIANTYDTDIVDGDYCQILRYKDKELKSDVDKYIDQRDYGHLLEDKNKTIATTGIWTGLYKKAFLMKEDIRLNESPGASFQDLSFMFLTSFLAKRVYHVKCPLYRYRVDNGGSSVKDESKIFEIIKECEFLKHELLKRDIEEKEYWELYYIRKYMAFYWNYCRLTRTAKEIFLEKYEEELKKDQNMISQIRFDSCFYNRTLLLLDNKEIFIDKAEQRPSQTFLERACDSLNKIDGNHVVLFGAGFYSIKLMNLLLQNKNHIDGICDNMPSCQGKIIGDFEVISTEQAVREFPESIYFITSSKYGFEMRTQLVEKGIPENNILVFE